MPRSCFRLACPVILSIAILCVCLWCLSTGSGDFRAEARSARAAGAIGLPATNVATDTRFVAVGGSDGSDCTDPAWPCRTVQYAVDVAGPGDSILVAAGIYTDLQTRPAPSGYPGSPIVTQVVFISQTLTVRGGYTTTDRYAGPPDLLTHPTSFDAMGRGRVVLAAGEITLTLENLELTGGNASQLGGDLFGRDVGGGLYLATGGTIRDVHIWGNTAGPTGSGGGVYLTHSNATLVGNRLALNTAGLHGGAGYLWLSPAHLSDNEIVANSVITFGGGLSLVGSPARMDGNRILTNTAGYGGGLYLDTSDAILTGNLVLGNEAWAGGGLYLSYAGWLSPSILVSNTFESNHAILGGGIWMIYAPSTVAGNVVISNTATDGGGLAMFSSETDFRQNQFVGNSATDEGGGLRIYYSNARLDRNQIEDNSARSGGGLWLGGSPVAMTGNLVIANSAHTGGGLYLLDSDASLANDVIAGNRAHHLGAGVLVAASAPRLRHTTIAGNWGGDGSGIRLGDQDGASSEVSMTNTILVGHEVGISVASGCTATLEATLWGAGPWANGDDWVGTGQIMTGTVNLWGDPAFADADHGDLHILGSSAAVDRGVDCGLDLDLDGEERPAGAGFDIGADEFVPDATQLYLPVVFH